MQNVDTPDLQLNQQSCYDIQYSKLNNNKIRKDLKILKYRFNRYGGQLGSRISEKISQFLHKNEHIKSKSTLKRFVSTRTRNGPKSPETI